jgi:hypothetical protein
VLWGSGVGADTSNDGRSYPAKQNNLNGISALYIGGVQAQVLYQGRSPYPGVDQVDVVIPNGVQGSFVSVTAVSGTGSVQLVRNTVTLPVEPNGGNCSDSNFSLTGDQFMALSAKSAPKTAVIQMNETQSPPGTISAASADGTFYDASPAQYGSGYGSASYGSCFVSEANYTGASWRWVQRWRDLSRCRNSHRDRRLALATRDGDTADGSLHWNIFEWLHVSRWPSVYGEQRKRRKRCEKFHRLGECARDSISVDQRTDNSDKVARSDGELDRG